MLEAVRIVGGTDNNPIRFYQASSSEMFGKVHETPQTERTPFHPRSPYGVAKVFGHYMTVNYREAYGIHAQQRASCSTTRARAAASSSSPARSPTRSRGSSSACRTRITLGNLDAARDWGYAGDYVEAMWMMLQQDEPDDYVIATGETHTIREFLDVAFALRRHRRLGAVRQAGPALLPARRGRPADRRRVEGAREARLEAAGQLRGARADDVRERPHGRERQGRSLSDGERRPGSRRRSDRWPRPGARRSASGPTPARTAARSRGRAAGSLRRSGRSRSRWRARRCASRRLLARRSALPSSRPVTRSATTFTVIGFAPG